MVASDEVRELRLQVDKLRERLDFMAPMLSLLQPTQDYVQRVECEASVQLLRLKNARLVDTPAGDLQKEDPHSVETAKWLHTVTDLVISRLSGDNANATPASPEKTAKREWRQQQQQQERQQQQQQQVASGQTSTRSTVYEDGAPATPSSSGSRSTTGSSHRRERAQQQQQQQQQQQHHMMSGFSAPDLRPARDSKRESRRQHQQSGGGDFVESAIFNRPSITSTRESNMDNTLTCGGLALGKGTWANAYRQATGLRRDALRLLCSTGIVTERELADDLTVISEEHIEECVTIAKEMLQKWTPELGPPPQQEAKAFFEEKLAAMYMKRAPAPFG